MIEKLIVATLVVWFLGSACAQFETAFFRKLRLQDVFMLFPGWSVYAPVPTSEDFYVLWRRYGCESAPLSSWIEIRYPARRIFYDWLWNPGSRLRQTIAVAIQWMSRDIERDDGVPMHLRPPYRFLLAWVAERIPQTTERFQFAIVRIRYQPKRSYKFVLISAIHRLQDAN